MRDEVPESSNSWRLFLQLLGVTFLIFGNARKTPVSPGLVTVKFCQRLSVTDSLTVTWQASGWPGCRKHDGYHVIGQLIGWLVATLIDWVVCLFSSSSSCIGSRAYIYTNTVYNYLHKPSAVSLCQTPSGSCRGSFRLPSSGPSGPTALRHRPISQPVLRVIPNTGNQVNKLPICRLEQQEYNTQLDTHLIPKSIFREPLLTSVQQVLSKHRYFIPSSIVGYSRLQGWLYITGKTSRVFVAVPVPLWKFGDALCTVGGHIYITRDLVSNPYQNLLISNRYISTN